jgi:hypothetical protein
MRPMLIIRENCLESVLGQGVEGEAVTVGMRVRASDWIDLSPHTLVQPGETGTVDYVDARTGLVEVLMDKHHKGLGDWDNHIWLVPFETEEKHLRAICCDTDGNAFEGESVDRCGHRTVGELRCSLCTVLLLCWGWVERLL